MDESERKIKEEIKQNEEEKMGKKINNIKKKIQEFRQNNKNFIRKIAEVLDNHKEEIESWFKDYKLLK